MMLGHTASRHTMEQMAEAPPKWTCSSPLMQRPYQISRSGKYFMATWVCAHTGQKPGWIMPACMYLDMGTLSLCSCVYWGGGGVHAQLPADARQLRVLLPDVVVESNQSKYKCLFIEPPSDQTYHMYGFDWFGGGDGVMFHHYIIFEVKCKTCHAWWPGAVLQHSRYHVWA